MSAIRAIAERVLPSELPSKISDGRLALWTGRRESASGVSVTPEIALTVGAIYACISLYCDTIGSFPVHIYRRGDQTRIPFDDHPNAKLLTRQPNPEFMSDEFWNQVVGWKLLRGNALAYIEQDDSGNATAIWQIPWTRVIPARTPAGELCYFVSLVRGDHAGDAPINERIVLLAHETMHWRDWGTGAIGSSRITLGSEAIGLALVSEEYGARYFANDATPGGMLVSPQRLEDDEWETIRRRWTSLHQGVKRSHVIGVLEDGLDWKDAGLSPKDSQLIELRDFQVEEVARWFRVPPFKIQVNKPGTVSYRSTEQGDLDFAKNGIMPKLTRLENVAGARLLDPDGTGEIFMRFSLDAFLRADIKTRHLVYGIGRQWGYLSANDIRRFEDMPPIPGGDRYLEPTNMGAPSADTRNALGMLERLGFTNDHDVTEDPASETVNSNGNHA